MCVRPQATYVSIHAPVKGATNDTETHQADRSFNSRTRKGCDVPSRLIWADLWVSIHAPVKGATRVVHCPICVVTVSIHAPVKGATFFAHNRRNIYHVSIHAPVKGATAIDKPCLSSVSRFNSRTRKGCDHLIHANNVYKEVSIHAPVKGATIIDRISDFGLSFQFTHP